MKARLPLFCTVALLLAMGQRAWAFSAPERFAMPAVDGGGGGRFFTGAPADGHACGVCHQGGVAPEITIRTQDAARLVLQNLPLSYQPGQRYTVTLTWPATGGSHALALELTDAEGRHPAVEHTPAASTPPQSRCDGLPNGPSAVYAVDVGARRILGVEDCGATQLDFSFVAPDTPELYFGAGIVRSNSSGTAEGDGVLELRHTLRRAGSTTAACAVLRGSAEFTPGVIATLAPLYWLFFFFRRRSNQSNRTPNMPVDSITETRCSPTKARYRK